MQSLSKKIPKKLRPFFRPYKRGFPNTLLPFLWHFMRPYKWNFIALFISSIVTAISISMTPYFLKIVVDAVNTYQGPPGDLIYAVIHPVIWYILVYAATNLNFRVTDYLVMKTLPKVKASIRLRALRHLQHQSQSFFQDNFAGALVSKISDMAKGSENIILLSYQVVISKFMALVIAAGVLLLVHPLFSIALILWGAVFLYVTAHLSQKSHEYSRILAESRSIRTGRLVDSVNNIANVQLFARRDVEIEYLGDYIYDTMRKDERLQRYMLGVKTFQGSAITALVAIMMAILMYLRMQGKVSVGDFAFILALSASIIQQMWVIAMELVRFSQELGVCSQALSIITVPHTIREAKNAKTLKVPKGEIKFNNVYFNYPTKDHPLYKGLDVTLAPGEKVGLVGLSGSGKSTFVNLILRYYDVHKGKITIDGQDIRKVTLDSLRKKVALIPQDPMLFHRSLFENIRYGNPSATKKDVMEASRRANCDDFIRGMTGGYDAMVGERGVKLSGGQRQRIAIARAILKDAPLLILDEATSALDSMTEDKIQTSLRYLMKGRTTIVIAHRLSTLRDMDRILVFKDGIIIEQGTHLQLIRQKGHYAELWNMQSGGFLLQDRSDEVQPNGVA